VAADLVATLDGSGVAETPRQADAAVPLWRLYALRAGYLLLVAGLGSQVWPGIVLRHGAWTLMEGVVQCMLGALSLLALLGLRYPLRMLPLLLFEIAWKVIWLAVVATPLWIAGRMDADTWSTAAACLMMVVFPIVIPWRHVWTTLVAAPGDRWR
jgi:hypothetical protein